jgi:hypothetical protein
MKNTFITLIITAALTCYTASVSVADTPSPHPQAEKTPGPQIVARVNGTPIYSDRLDAGINKGLKKYKKFGMKNASPELMYTLQTRELDKHISNELIRQESKKLKITDIDKKAGDKFLAIKKNIPKM